MRSIIIMTLMVLIGCHKIFAIDSNLIPKHEESYIVLSTLIASADSELGDLRTKQFETDDIELRFWYGYGKYGTYGFILRRINGDWSYTGVEIEDCPIHVPDAVSAQISDKHSLDTLESGLEERKYAKQQYGKHQKCPELLEIGPIFILNLIHIKQIPAKINAAALWDRLVSYGILDFPQGGIYPAGGVSGREPYFVELRRGVNYRSSLIIEAYRPKSDADKQLQIKVEKIAEVIRQYVQPEEEKS